MNENTLVIAYGFEYEKVIINDNDCRIGRTINGKNPVYCSLFIEDKDINTIIDKIKLTEKYREHYLIDIDKLAKRKKTVPKWQIIRYNKEYEYYIHVLQGKILQYDSEMDPCF
jgi:DNA mismatch repair ATPase MutS